MVPSIYPGLANDFMLYIAQRGTSSHLSQLGLARLGYLDCRLGQRSVEARRHGAGEAEWMQRALHQCHHW